MAKLIENEVNGIQLKEGQTVLDVDGNEYLIEKGDILQERTGDWRLPDKEELNLMYGNLHLKGIGNFSDNIYWSSSEDNSYGALSQYFGNGYQDYLDKVSVLRVRAVQSFHSKAGGDTYKIGEDTPKGFVFDIQDGMVFVCKKQDEHGKMDWYEAMEKFGA